MFLGVSVSGVQNVQNFRYPFLHVRAGVRALLFLRYTQDTHIIAPTSAF